MSFSPEFQIKFLNRIQNILDDGAFTATYKFALLNALADICLETESDNPNGLIIDLKMIGEKYIEYYWRQTDKFSAVNELVVLSQNTGKQAAIIRLIEDFRSTHFSKLEQSKNSPEFSTLTSQVTSIIKKQPLPRLQRIGKSDDNFIYEIISSREIRLYPGIDECFRKFHGLIVNLVRGAWIKFVRKYNNPTLGSHNELSELLFGKDRMALVNLVPPLKEIQSGKCFYCSKELKSKSLDVDHFIPWAKYSHDLAHNFVLSCSSCNRSKSSHLAAPIHLEKWVEFINLNDAEIINFANARNIAYNKAGSLNVAHNYYREAAAAELYSWVTKEDFEIVTDSCLRAFNQQ